MGAPGPLKFKVKVWLYPGMAGWHFVTLPVQIAKQVNNDFGNQKRGWGSLPVEATIGKTAWKTSIFPDKESGSFVLPIKAEVRKKEDLAEGSDASVSLVIAERGTQ